MKAILILSVILAIVCCQVYPLNVSNECSSLSCDRSTWRYNSTIYNLTCPKAGNSLAQLRMYQGFYVLDLIAYNTFSSDVSVSLPLIENYNATSDGVQYYAALDSRTPFDNYDSYFVIFNCSLPASYNYTNLCRSHQLVGGKIYNSTFQAGCAFGLDKPRNNFLSAEPIEYSY